MFRILVHTHAAILQARQVMAPSEASWPLCVQAALDGIIPADNITVFDVMRTGGPDNYPYVTLLDNPDLLTSEQEAVNATVETLIQFYYPTRLRAALKAAIDSGSIDFSSNGITGLSLTGTPCDASSSGSCAPGMTSLELLF